MLLNYAECEWLRFHLSEFDLRRFLCTESEELVWKSEGLPSDDLSIENALVILQVNLLFCLVLDVLKFLQISITWQLEIFHLCFLLASQSTHTLRNKYICNNGFFCSKRKKKPVKENTCFHFRSYCFILYQSIQA